MRRAATHLGMAPPIRSCLAAMAIVLFASCQRVDEPSLPSVRSAAAHDTPEVVTTRGGIEMVEIPAGRFTMGSSGGEADEEPAHEVRVDAFLLGHLRYLVGPESSELPSGAVEYPHSRSYLVSLPQSILYGDNNLLVVIRAL